MANVRKRHTAEFKAKVAVEAIRQLGQVVSERDWLKKKVHGHPLAIRKTLLDERDSQYSLRQQCGLLGINRSSLHYEPTGEREENLLLMRLLDEQYTRAPYYGVLKMTEHLRGEGHAVNPKRVRRLLRTMGLEAIYQKPNTSKPNSEHKVFPYLLRGLPIDRCDQVWSTDITYVRLARGFVYLMAVIDWYSRYVLGNQHHAGS